MMNPSSKNPVRNLHFPPSITSGTAGSWLPSHHAREIKIGTQGNNQILLYSYKNPFFSAKWSNIFTKFSGLVSEGPPNERYMVDIANLLQLVALYIWIWENIDYHGILTIPEMTPTRGRKQVDWIRVVSLNQLKKHFSLVQFLERISCGEHTITACYKQVLHTCTVWVVFTYIQFYICLAAIWNKKKLSSAQIKIGFEKVLNWSPLIRDTFGMFFFSKITKFGNYLYD